MVFYCPRDLRLGWTPDDRARRDCHSRHDEVRLLRDGETPNEHVVTNLALNPIPVLIHHVAGRIGNGRADGERVGAGDVLLVE